MDRNRDNSPKKNSRRGGWCSFSEAVRWIAPDHGLDPATESGRKPMMAEQAVFLDHGRLFRRNEDGKTVSKEAGTETTNEDIELGRKRDDAWKRSAEALVWAAATEEVEIIGRIGGKHAAQPIQPIMFSGISVFDLNDLPMSAVHGEVPHIRATREVVPHDHWERKDDFDDKLFSGKQPYATHLQASWADLRRCFPKASGHRVRNENEAIAILSKAFRDNKDLTRAAAKALIVNKIGSRAFQNRVWPEARILAGLEPTAPPGAKRKNRHA